MIDKAPHRDSHISRLFIVLILSATSQQITVGRGLFPRSGHVDRAGVDTRVPRGVLVLGELRAAPIRSEGAGALQRGRGTGGEVVRKCGLGC